MIRDFIEDVCDILNIDVPQISHDTAHFQSETAMAQCNTEKYAIYLKKKEKPDPDYLFAIAHELRHLWQYKKHEQRYLKKYQPREAFQSIEEYNLQDAEVDANAFAGLVMMEFFRLAPQYNGLTEKVKNRIHARMQEIKDEI